MNNRLFWNAVNIPQRWYLSIHLLFWLCLRGENLRWAVVMSVVSEGKQLCSLARCRMQVQYYLQMFKTLFDDQNMSEKDCELCCLSLETALLSNSCYSKVVETWALRHLNVSLMQEQQEAAFTADCVTWSWLWCH